MKIASFLWHLLIIIFNCKIALACIMWLYHNYKQPDVITAMILTNAIAFSVIIIGLSIKKIINLK